MLLQLDRDGLIKLPAQRQLPPNNVVRRQRQVIEAVSCSPEKCRRIVEDLGEVYRIDALARERNLSPEERLALHQEKSSPVMAGLERWMSDQLESKLVEPNSALGGAIK